MKTTIKNNRWMNGLVVAGSLLLALAPQATAEVSDADFNALKESVQKLSTEVESLKQTNTLQQQVHREDVEQIQQLQVKLTETRQIATNAEQKSMEAAQTQPLPRQPLDEATVNHNFLITGDAEFQYVKADGQHGAFVFADFAPIFLYRANDNILFEAGFDTTIQNDTTGTHDSGQTTSFDLSFAQIDYVMNEYATFCAGDLLLPLGTYSIRTAGWLNKFPDDPLAVGLIPGAGVGAMLQSGIPIGDSGKLLNYQIYGVNGPSSSDGTADPGALDLGGNVGLKNDNTVANMHGGLTGGGRVGIFMPFKPHYDLELGLSGQSGEWDDAGQHLYTAGVFDAALHLGPSFEAKGEYILDRYGSDMGQVSQQGWWVQAGYKLAGLNLEFPLINNVELMGRYDSLHNAPGSVGFSNTKRYTAGFIYYITNTMLFEGDYEFLDSNDPAMVDQLVLQLSLGF
jgi:hypothetical protein